MIDDFFFGTMAALGWAVTSTIFFFLASYTWLIVYDVGGIRGTAMATVFTGLAIVTGCFGMILSGQTLVPNFVWGALITMAFPPVVLACIVLADLYAADKNSHRSFTARSYLWYERRVRRGHGERRQSRDEVRSGGAA
jgi:hypothetical protein